MSEFVVMHFPIEAKALEGSRALQELHEEGSLSVGGMAVLVKDADGKVSVKEPERPGPPGAVLGALFGGLVGLIGRGRPRRGRRGARGWLARCPQPGCRHSTPGWTRSVAPSCASGGPTSRTM